MSLFAHATIHVGDALAVLRTLPADHFHCCVTSPPYWGLRDYGTAAWEGGDPEHRHDRVLARGGRGGSGAPGKQTTGAFPDDLPADVCSCGARRIDAQIGLEPTPDQYVARIVEVFRAVRRVLRRDGTLWLNMGDSYNNAGSSRNGEGLDGKRRGGATGPSGELGYKRRDNRHSLGKIKHKDLIGIPWRVAFALQADGWWLRQDIIWHKPNPMPESVTDRCTKAHEYVFLLTKAERYYYDAEAIKEPQTRIQNRQDWLRPRAVREEPDAKYKGKDNPRGGGLMRRWLENPDKFLSGRNLRSVWTIPTQPFPGAHFATFPEALVEPCILAGTSERGCCAACGAPWERVVEQRPSSAARVGGDANWHKINQSNHRAGGYYDHESKTTGWRPTCACGAAAVPCRVLDPFSGSATVGVVALRHGADFTGVELSAAYVELAKRRLEVPVEVVTASPAPRPPPG